MRIIAGKHRGRRIETLDSKKLRPTTGMAREAVFNILSHGQFEGLLDDCDVLDLYCGCGALAAEALSRGARSATLIDIDQEHLNIARDNITAIGEDDYATFLRANSSTPPLARHTCNLVFIDPPYHQGLVDKTLNNLMTQGWLADQAVLVIETNKTEEIALPLSFEQIIDRNYGNSRIRFVTYDAAQHSTEAIA